MNDAFFLGGIEKSRVLKVLRPHIFFDDQQQHLDTALDHIAGVHIPYGVANLNESTEGSVAGLDVAFPLSDTLEATSDRRVLSQTETADAGR